MTGQPTFRAIVSDAGSVAERHRKMTDIETSAIQALVALSFFKHKKGLMTTKRLSAGPAVA
jgi:hypothetical protein